MSGWSTSCLDWRDRLLAGRSLVPELPLFEEEAARAVRVFNRLRLPDVAGKPRLSEATGDWFRDIVRALFGAYDPATGERAIQEVFLLVPKKNGKSTNAAGVMVTAAIVNRRPEAELLLIAPTKEIADIAFRQASGMIRADPDLDALFHLQRHIRTITHRLTGAQVKIVAADTDAVTGSKATYVLIDETHVFAARPRAADVFVELRGALAARPDGFLFQITTQSKTPPAGVFKSELRSARDVRDGVHALPLLPVLYELPADLAANDGWKRPELFGAVNPNLGRSVNVAFLKREIEKAQREGAEQLALFASQHLNVEIGMALRSDGWPGAEQWAKQARPNLTLAEVLARSEVVTVGIDGGGLDDLLGLAVLGRERDTRDWLLWSRAWAHPIVLDRRKAEAARLRDFAASGDLRLVERIGQDIDEVADLVAEVKASGLLWKVGLDPAGVGALVDALAERGVGGDDVAAVSQGWRLNGAIKTAERKLADGTLWHAGSAMMAWAVSNAKVEPKGNAISITKQVSGSAKIDPLMAALNAVDLMSRNPAAAGGSSYLSGAEMVILT